MEFNFALNIEEQKLVSLICKRALKLAPGEYSFLDLQMDITVAHNHAKKLDFKKLAEADDYNLAHDVFGINRHINRESGELENCFVPRCSLN